MQLFGIKLRELERPEDFCIMKKLYFKEICSLNRIKLIWFDSQK